MNPASSPFATNQKRSQSSLLPVTINQVLKASALSPDSPLSIDGNEVSNLVLVGRIHALDQKQTALSLVLDDGSGQIECRKWLEANAVPQDYAQNSHVKVIGTVKTYNGKRSINVHSIIRVTDHNIIAHHLLSVIHSHLYFTRSIPKSTVHYAGQYSQEPTTSTPTTYREELNMDRLPAEVYQIIKANTLNDPISIKDIAHRLRGLASEEDVENAIQFLESEGRVYTVDNDRVLTTG
jgi:RecG-like helicase